MEGALLTSFAPGGEEMTLCNDRQGACSTFPMGAVSELRYRSNGAGQGAMAGLYTGMLVGVAVDTVGPGLVFGGLVGGVAGWFLGSVVTTWPTVATRGGGRLLWSPGPMIIPEPSFREKFLTACARGDSLPRADLVAVVRSTRGPYHADVRRAWLVDAAVGRLVPVSTDGIRCRNESWLALAAVDSLRAPAESASSALRFTATPGKARLYLYHVNSFIHDPFVIMVDTQVIGPLRYDRYVTIEVDPGRHRLGAVGLSDSVTFEAQADNVHFIKIMPGSWKITGTLFTAELVDAVRGRKMILASDLMP